jgi:hypothetical protein
MPKTIDGKNLDGNLFSTNIMNLVLPILRRLLAAKIFQTTCPFLQFDSNGANDKRAALERVSKPELSDDF